MKNIFKPWALIYIVVSLLVQNAFAQTIFIQHFDSATGTGANGTWTSPAQVQNGGKPWSGTLSPANSVWHGANNCSGWSSTGACNETPSSVCGGSNGANGTAYSAMFDNYDNGWSGGSPGTQGYIQTPLIDISSYASNSCKQLVFSFYWFNYSNTSATIQVQFSSNGASGPFTTYGTYSPYTSSCGWMQSAINIPSSYLVSNFVIRFVATSDGQPYSLNIDEVVITAVAKISEGTSFTSPSCFGGSNGT